MSDLVPASGLDSASPPASVLEPLTDPAGGTMLTRLRNFAAQDPVQRVLPLFVGLSVLGGAALAWSTLAPSPQRTLYAQISDGDRAAVVSALDQASIGYDIDSGTGTITVAEEDFYRARMLVAADGALATPESGADMLDSLPMGASRMLEGQRLRASRERDLMLTIREIDGVESVRVHLAEGEKSVFVRDNVPPSASVMLRLARGRQLSQTQVGAIVNLVAGSVPGLSIDKVRVVDQHGRLLSDPAMGGADNDRLELQSRMEEKLRTQVAQLLTPMLGTGNFSSEIQVQLDMDEVTSARESYDKDGVVRSETQAESNTTGPATASGVPGVLANTPPRPTEAEARPPQGTDARAVQSPPVNGETSSTRTYELGREVSVANKAPGKITRLSVAVALSKEAMKASKPADLKQIEELVSAAVGASAERGDTVKVVARSFEPVVEDQLAFYETSWFATVVRQGAAIIALLLVLLLGVRPLMKSLRRAGGSDSKNDGAPVTSDGNAPTAPTDTPGFRPVDRGLLNEKVGLAQRLVSEQPDSAVAALRQMLNEPGPDTEDADEQTQAAQ